MVIPDAVYVRGAYGREACLADWEAGKDFYIVPQGPYMSIRDLPKLRADGWTHVVLLDKKAEAVHSVKL